MTSSAITQDPVIERLRQHRVVGRLPAEEIDWIYRHGSIRTYERGEIIISQRQEQPISELAIVLTGRIVIYIDYGSGPRKVMEWVGGDITGLLPYSRLTKAPGESFAEEPTETFVVHKDHFRELTRECPHFTEALVQLMLDRARHFREADLTVEKMASLGQLAAGLAHELHNPAAAVVRSAKLLISLLDEAEAAARNLGATNITPEQVETLKALKNECLGTRLQALRSPLEQARHEEEILDWVEDRGITLASAEALAETPITTALLDSLAESVDEALLEPALRWLAAGCAVRRLISEIDEAAGRMSNLVQAVKGFTHMDLGSAPQQVDIEQGLSQTLTVLRGKARGKSARVTINAQPGLPHVEAYGGELNQIWVNLLANALDAIPEGGTVEVTARQEGNNVVVAVIDDGPGIPPEIQKRIFDPFFTTKGVGHGTGLGLDIVRRLVDHNGGTVGVSSRPGRTEFRVTVPIRSGHA